MKLVYFTSLLVLILLIGFVSSCGRVDVIKGDKGDKGDTGSVGPIGPQGPPGSPGSTITQVKLCDDDTSAYPEYALRIDTQLYAVYWGTTPTSNGQKQAFLALIIPGTYQSTGGNGCYFRVNSDGSITRL